MSGLRRPVLASALALALGGCAFEAFTYTIDRYGTAKGVNVRLGCEDTYEVFDRPEQRALLVVSGLVTELAVDACGSGAPLAQRQRRIAEIFLGETTNRPLCRLGAETEVSPLHREFNYVCPAQVGPAGAGPARRG